MVSAGKNLFTRGAPIRTVACSPAAATNSAPCASTRATASSSGGFGSVPALQLALTICARCAMQ
jgi:hypothetical protein